MQVNVKKFKNCFRKRLCQIGKRAIYAIWLWMIIRQILLIIWNNEVLHHEEAVDLPCSKLEVQLTSGSGESQSNSALINGEDALGNLDNPDAISLVSKQSEVSVRNDQDGCIISESTDTIQCTTTQKNVFSEEIAENINYFTKPKAEDYPIIFKYHPKQSTNDIVKLIKLLVTLMDQKESG